MKHRATTSVILLVFTSLFLTACAAPGYYLQAISGQWKLMHAREDIHTLLNDPDTSEELKNELKVAAGIIEFADSNLGLPANGSYSSYVELQSDAIAWNVIATPEFSLQPKKWCFAVAGCLPYRGYFKQQKAQDFSRKLGDRGMDVIVSPAPAYSTLGKLKDPLLSTMLNGSETRLAAYLFHELAHQRLYVKDDGQFNESYASFVEQVGIKAWLETRADEQALTQWRVLIRVEKDFAELITAVRKNLQAVYLEDHTDTVMRDKKATIFEELKASYEIMVKQRWEDKKYYSAWFETPLNNARLALFNTYKGGQCAFQGLMDQAGGDIQKFHDLAVQQAGLQNDKRKKWLNQTCPVIAPATEL